MRISAYVKTIVAAIMAGLVTLNTVIGDGSISASDVVTIALAVLGALGVYALPNTVKRR